MRIIPTDTLDETEDGGGNSEPSSALLQACGPREPHPRQVDILLDKGMLVTCVKYNGRPRTFPGGYELYEPNKPHELNELRTTN